MLLDSKSSSNAFSDSIFVDLLLRFSSFSTRPGSFCSPYIAGILLWSLYSIITITLRVWLRWANTPTCLSSLCHWLALELCDHRRQQTSMIINLLEKISWSLSLFLLWLLLSQQTQDHIYRAFSWGLPLFNFSCWILRNKKMKGK